MLILLVLPVLESVDNGRVDVKAEASALVVSVEGLEVLVSIGQLGV